MQFRSKAVSLITRAAMGGCLGVWLLLVGLPAGQDADQAVSELARLLRELRWICYSPSTGNPKEQAWASAEDIQADLELLRSHGFTGIITYGCNGTGAEVPAIARRAGFSGIILGVWDPLSEEELSRARSVAAQVDGICVGNEGLTLGGGTRYSFAQLGTAIEEIRKATGRPVTTAEPMEAYKTGGELLELGDWVFPIVHPYWHGVRSAKEAAAWTLRESEAIAIAAQGRPFLMKEVGFPTAGDADVSEQVQADYYELLCRSGARFAYFEAFDQAWKDHEAVEPHWGLFGKDRQPKAVVGRIKDCAPLSSEGEDIEFESPKTKESVVCQLTGNGGKIQVSGTSRGLYGKGYRLVLFVNPQHPSARGWYLQAVTNGIDTFAPDGNWQGMSQLGNTQYPPRGGEIISMAVVALREAEAEQLFARAKAGVVVLDTLPQVPEQRVCIASDVKVAVK